MTNNTDNLTRYSQDMERYENIIKYFIRNSDRKIPQNVGYLQDVITSLKKIYSGINDAEITNVDALKSILIKEHSKYLCDKLQSILSKDIKKKLNSIEDSRKEKKESLLSQWLGD
jgi:hypothetical protein